MKRLVKFIVKYKFVSTTKLISFMTWRNYVFNEKNYVLTKTVTFLTISVICWT